ncbi:MAG: nuclear transport factor 2 family protein, partial [Oscillatoria sp. PMC 1076.18]|nr:nuclear transport factor 2 family protein [Oscillatoria sp. PMC 1076.18]
MNFVNQPQIILASLLTGLSVFSPFSENYIFSISPVSASETQQIIAQTTTITETEIKQIIAELNEAANNKNVDGISKYFSPEATVEISLQSALGSQNFAFNRDEYLFYLQESFNNTENYQQSYENLVITISPDGKTATATLNVSETVEMEELNISGTSQETILF